MPVVAADTVSSVGAQVTRRWQAIDPLLPESVAPPPGCGAEFVVAGADGRSAAIATCEHWEGAAESLELTWGAARRLRLAAQMSGPDIGNALDQLLSQWRDHLGCVPGVDGEDIAAVVTWPSRDIDGVAALVRHGLAPFNVLAARTTGRGPANGPARQVGDGAGGIAGTARQDLRIRRAAQADIDTVVRLGLEAIRFDAHFGGVIERPGTADALRRDTAGLLAGRQAWTWLAERDGTAIGMLAAERPESAGWIAPMTRASPVAYLKLMIVLPGERGNGVGAALVDRLHREADAAGVAVTLLHYEQTNPLSVPFWSQQGYRPLWTSWEARPARAIR